MQSYRKRCLKQQTELRQVMLNADQAEAAIQLFLHQHAMLHSARMAQTEPWSFEDEVFNDLHEAQIRCIPPGCAHSIVWLIWHIARCEDITMNLLVAGSLQILHQEKWLERLGITARDTGNAMDREEITTLSAGIDVPALRAYRMAVGSRTRAVVQQLDSAELKRKISPAQIERVMEEGAVLEAARGIAEYWSRRDVAGLLLMPATRHNMTHLNEALELKRRV